MSAASAKPADERSAPEPKDNQERRLHLKREAVSLGGELAAYGARVDLGKVTPARAVVEIRQEGRDRRDVVVTVEDDAPVYTVVGPAGEEEMFSSLEVRRRLLAPPGRWNRVWTLVVAAVAWGLVAIGWAIYVERIQVWVLAGIVVGGIVVTLAASSLVTRIVRARRRHRTVLRLNGRR